MSIIQDDARLDADPGRHAGPGAPARRAGGARVGALELDRPRGERAQDARHFNATDPSAYPAENWRPVGHHRDRRAPGRDQGRLRPDGRRPTVGARARPSRRQQQPELGAVGERVRSLRARDRNPLQRQLRPAGSRATPRLPRVDFWTVWNEPDYGPSLAPQGVPGHLTVENSPRMYRNLLGAAWRSLLATGHSTATDTIAFGELAPRGESFWGVFSGMKPLDVPASVVLRGLVLPPASRERGADPGLPAHGGGVEALPGAEPGAVRGQRRVRPSVHALVQAQPRAQSGSDQPLLDDQLLLARGDRQPDRRARSTPARVRVEDPAADLRHRVRVHHQPAQAQPGSHLEGHGDLPLPGRRGRRT